jgi:hypothetical protein
MGALCIAARLKCRERLACPHGDFLAPNVMAVSSLPLLHRLPRNCLTESRAPDGDQGE